MTAAAVWWRRMAVQIIVFLSIALLPIGLISVLQTRNVSADNETRATHTLLALTDQAANETKMLIQHALGAAQTLSVFARDDIQDQTTCSARLQEYAATVTRYDFVAFVPTTGMSICSSDGAVRDFSNLGATRNILSKRRPSVDIFEGGFANDQPDVVVSQPVIGTNGEQIGFVALSVPIELSSLGASDVTTPGFIALILMTADGKFLTVRSDTSDIAEQVTISEITRLLQDSGRKVLFAENQTGEKRLFTASPIVNDTLFVVAVWDATVVLDDHQGNILTPAVFPILMWIVSLLVAFMAVDRLAVRHIRDLGKIMGRFARNRALPDDPDLVEMPAELAQMRHDFLGMAHGILQDEAALEDALRNRNVLLKEVHHRVKNNLQLIASIMNILARSSKSDETRAVVRQLQDRVLSLATIHRDLYQSQDMGRINAGLLVREIVEKNVDLVSNADDPVQLITEIGDVSLFPDQAVPLSLFVSEAIGNATKYLASDEAGSRWIKVTFSAEANRVLLLIANSTGPVDGVESTGMGAVLMDAFVVQLGGEKSISVGDGHYELLLTFKVADFVAETVDY